jgi:hypothetical protein
VAHAKAALFWAIFEAAQEVRMRGSIVRQLVLMAALAGAVAGCNTQRQQIPTISAEAAAQLPASKLPRIFRDPNPLLAYPYNIHETDGLSPNPDDCARWGCVGVGNR